MLSCLWDGANNWSIRVVAAEEFFFCYKMILYLIAREETRCRHTGYSFRLTARVLLYAPSHRQDSTYHGLCYTSHGALAGTRNSSMDPPHEGSIRRPIAPWANALTTELHLAQLERNAASAPQLLSISNLTTKPMVNVIDSTLLMALCKTICK